MAIDGDRDHGRFETPAWRLAFLLLGGLILFFAGPPVIIAIGHAFGLIVAAFGLAVGLGAGSVALSGGIAPWVIPAASAGIAAAGTAAIIKVGAEVVEEAEKHPFKWIAPILGVLSTFVANFVKELFPITGVPRAALGATIGALTVSAGILWRQPGKTPKVLAALMVVIPPLLGLYESADWSLGLVGAITQVSNTTWLSLLLLLAVLLLTLLFAATTD